MLYLVVELQESADSLQGEFSMHLRGVYLQQEQAARRVERLQRREGYDDYCGVSHFFHYVEVQDFGPMDILLVEDGWDCRSYVRSSL